MANAKVILSVLLVAMLLSSGLVYAESIPQSAESKVDHFKKPLYTPFIERYILDELKQLRVDMDAQKADLTKKLLIVRFHRLIGV